jgi:hypothetical protein
MLIIFSINLVKLGALSCLSLGPLHLRCVWNTCIDTAPCLSFAKGQKKRHVYKHIDFFFQKFHWSVEAGWTWEFHLPKKRMNRAQLIHDTWKVQMKIDLKVPFLSLLSFLSFPENATFFFQRRKSSHTPDKLRWKISLQYPQNHSPFLLIHMRQ